MPVPSLPVAAVAPGNVLTSTMWNAIVKDAINKLFNQGHRVLTVAQFAALTGLEGTKGTVAPDEVYLEVDATNGVLWHLVYESGEPTYKWRFIGGPPLISEVTTDESTVSAVFAALTTAGPSVPLPRAGDYDVKLEHSGYVNNNNDLRMSYDIGGTGAVDADSTYIQGNNQGALFAARFRRKTGLTAVTLTAKYRLAAGTGHFLNRFMAVTPVRITN